MDPILAHFVCKKARFGAKNRVFLKYVFLYKMTFLGSSDQFSLGSKWFWYLQNDKMYTLGPALAEIFPEIFPKNFHKNFHGKINFIFPVEKFPFGRFSIGKISMFLTEIRLSELLDITITGLLCHPVFPCSRKLCLLASHSV